MRSPRTLTRCLTAALLVAATVSMATTEPAGAATVSVGTQAAYRTALAATPSGPYTITLTADITLTAGHDPVDPTYTGTQPLTIDGAGHTINANHTSRALHVTTSAALIVQDITIRNGTGALGAGSYSSGAVTVTNSTITNNTATGTNGSAYGAGIFSSSGAVTVTNSTITNNTATGTGTGGSAYGAGIRGGGAVTVTNSTITNNTATATGADGSAYGGGLSSLGAVTVTNSTITNNTATATGADGSAFGGGLYSSGAVTVTNSTITNNTATTTGVFSASGGGIRSGGAVTVTFATVTGNNAATGANLRAVSLVSSGSVVAGPVGGTNCQVGGSASAGYNWVSDGSCGLAGTGDTIGTDPQLGALADNGGPTRTRLPAVTSPLVDAIPNGSCPTGLTADQRNQPRPSPAGGACDIGAVERLALARPDGRIRRGTAGALRGNNIYNTLTGQTATGTAARGRSVTYDASIQNDAAFNDTIKLRGAGSTSRFTVTYRNPAGQNITNRVVAGTYPTPTLTPSATHRIKITITIRNTAPPGASLTRTLKATSTTHPTRTDTVRTITRRS